MISRLPEEKPCKAEGKERLRVHVRMSVWQGAYTTHPGSGCCGQQVTLEGEAEQPSEWHEQLQWYSP